MGQKFSDSRATHPQETPERFLAALQLFQHEIGLHTILSSIDGLEASVTCEPFSAFSKLLNSGAGNTAVTLGVTIGDSRGIINRCPIPFLPVEKMLH